VRQLVDLATRLGKLERRVAGMMRHGPVHEVDPKAATVRLRLGGTDDKPFLSPKIPYAQVGGALKVHAPPSVGQQMTLMAPNGDWRQAVALPATWSEANKAPSDKGDENVLTFGGCTLSVKGNVVTLEVAEVTITADVTIKGDLTVKGDVALEGGGITHNGANIGATHRHTEVERGGRTSGPPEAGA
jgi:phage baseplate assembly protein gpV